MRGFLFYPVGLSNEHHRVKKSKSVCLIILKAESYWVKMLEWIRDNAPHCMFKDMFGVDCPGCGMTRAFFALLRGDLTTSLAYNPALIPFLITLVVLFIQLKIKHPKGGMAVMWLFIITSSVAMINCIVKQYLIISGH